MFGTEANKAAVEQLGLNKDSKVFYASLTASHLQDESVIFKALTRIRQDEPHPAIINLNHNDDREDLEMAIGYAIKHIKLPPGHFIVGAAPENSHCYVDTEFGLVDLTAFPELWHAGEEEEPEAEEDPYQTIEELRNTISRFVEMIPKWHQNIMSQLNTAIEHKEAKVELGDIEIEPGSDLHKGFRLGLIVAKDMFDPLPFTVSHAEEDESEEDSL